MISLVEFAATLAVLVAQQQSPPPDPQPFESLARANTYPIRLEANGDLSGPGVEFLLAEAESSQFIAFGEEHGEVKSNQLIAALFPLLQSRAGYQHLMVEQGAIISSQVSAPPLRGDIDAISAYAAAYPHAFTFVSDQELEMLASVSATSRAANPIWGCEIEFGVGHALNELGTLVPPASAAGLAARRLAEDAHEIESPRSSPLHFMRQPQTAERLTELERLVEHETEDTRARFIAEKLAQSARIFALYDAGERGEVPGHYSNNALREDYMVSECLAQYRAAEEATGSLPRAVLKLGHYHTMHGLNPNRIRTMGSFFGSLARSNDRGYLLLSVLAYGPDGGMYPRLESSRLIWPLFGRALDLSADFAVIDFRPLREYPYVRKAITSANIDAAGAENLRQLIYAYDGALVVLNARQGDYQRVNAAPPN